MTKNLVFLASGRGSNFQSFVEHVKLGVLTNVSIAALVCNHQEAKVLELGRSSDVPTVEIEGVAGKSFVSREERDRARVAFDNQCIAVIEKYKADYVVLAGFDQIISRAFVDTYPFRILNIHPAYDMKRFGGKNMVGAKVHDAVIASGTDYSGLTVHFVTNSVDQGPAILKRRVSVLEGDSSSTLESRVLAQEHVAYPEAIQLLVDGRVFVSESGDRCFVDRFSGNWDIDFWYRQRAYLRGHPELRVL